MPTNLALDDQLLEQAMQAGKFRTKRDTVNTALAELIARRQQLRVLDIAGTIDFRNDWNYKKDRKTRAVAHR